MRRGSLTPQRLARDALDAIGRVPRIAREPEPDLPPKPADWGWGRTADAVVTLGCGDECPALLGGKARDGALPDPKGMNRGDARSVRDEIERRVIALLREIGA